MIFLRWIILFCVLVSSMVQAEVAVPELKTRVTDLSQTLTATEIAQLETKLAQLEQAKGSQIAILIVPSTEPETIEQFSLRVVEQWKLGRKKIDAGVLLLVAKNDRAVRIEVGYGLEGVIPDAIANRITDEYIVPAFKQGDYFGGIDVAVQKLTDLIQGETLPKSNAVSEYSLSDWILGLILAVIVGIQLISKILKNSLLRIMSSSIAGIAIGILVWMVLGDIITGTIFGFFVFLFTLPGTWMGSGDSYSRDGFSGGGGFKGGGGSFGGGGATGRW